MISSHILTELGYVLICQIKKKKKCSFENALVEKSESSARNKNGLVEGLLLFSILVLTVMMSATLSHDFFVLWTKTKKSFNLVESFKHPCKI